MNKFLSVLYFLPCEAIFHRIWIKTARAWAGKGAGRVEGVGEKAGAGAKANICLGVGAGEGVGTEKKLLHT